MEKVDNNEIEEENDDEIEDEDNPWLKIVVLTILFLFPFRLFILVGSLMVLHLWLFLTIAFNYGFNFEQMRCLAEGIQDNIYQKLREDEDMQVEVEEMEQVKIEGKFGDRFCRGGVDLLYLAAYEAIHFHESIANRVRAWLHPSHEIVEQKRKEKELARLSQQRFLTKFGLIKILLTKKEEADKGLTQAAKQLKPTRLSNAELKEKTLLNKEEDRLVFSFSHTSAPIFSRIDCGNSWQSTLFSD